MSQHTFFVRTYVGCLRQDPWHHFRRWRHVVWPHKAVRAALSRQVAAMVGQQGEIWWRRGESNYSRLLKTRKLLKNIDSRNARIAQKAVRLYVACTWVGANRCQLAGRHAQKKFRSEVCRGPILCSSLPGKNCSILWRPVSPALL